MVVGSSFVPTKTTSEPVELSSDIKFSSWSLVLVPLNFLFLPIATSLLIVCVFSDSFLTFAASRLSM